MPQVCTVCRHPERASIDRSLVRGASLRDIAGQHDLSKSALERHKASDLPRLLVQARDAEVVADADDLLGQLRSLQARTLSLLDQAERAGRLGTAVMAIREARANIELIAELVHELDRRPVVNLWMSADWQQVRSVLLGALGPFPEARAAVVQRLVEAETG